MAVTLTVNGSRRSVPAEPDTPLLYVLRNDFELNGAKFGCGLAQCGACTVLVNGEAFSRATSSTNATDTSRPASRVTLAGSMPLILSELSWTRSTSPGSLTVD